MGLRAGTTFIDLVISLAILFLLFGGIFLVYISVFDTVTNVELRTTAASVLQAQVETVRNLPYTQIGTVGGTPSGVIPQSRNVAFGSVLFVVDTTVRNIDDPFDGTLGGTPNDTAPADYKLVSLEISCPGCPRFRPLSFTTTVSPKGLESTSSTGSLFVNVFDATGAGVSAATVRLINEITSPTIDVTDVTNASGVLQFVGIPTSTERYQLSVSKTGYSSARTYPIGGVANPNPTKPNATVAPGAITTMSFSIDRVSTIALSAKGLTCAAIPSADFSIVGTKLIGTSPDVVKFSTSSATNASGTWNYSSLEWDTYLFSLTDSALALMGTVPFTPLTVNPGSSASFDFFAVPADPKALSVAVKNSVTGAGITDATVTVSRSGFTASSTTGRSTLTHTDWSGSAYASQSGGIDAELSPGEVMLLASASSTYATGTVESLISNTIDLGTSVDAEFHGFSWGGDEPGGVGSDAVRFQLAANNDNATWNYVGPDGTSNSYYTASPQATESSLNGKRYLRYTIYLQTQDEDVTPSVTYVSLEFSSGCVPPYHALFTGLASFDYDITVDAPGYTTAMSSVSASSSAWQTATVTLTPQ